MKKRNGKPSQGAKLLLAGATLAAVLAMPLTAGAANLGSTPFQVKATNIQEPKFYGIRPNLAFKTADPTTPPVTTPPATTPPAADLAPKTVAMAIDTSLPGCAASNFNLQVYGSIDFFPNAKINWGDGTSTDVKNGATYSHSYAAGSSYNLTIDGTLQGLYRNISDPDTGANNCIKSVDHIGSDTGMTVLKGFLSNAKNVQSVAAPPTSVTDYSDMFLGATSFNGNISDWDTSKVTNFEGMFFNASKFNQPLNSWKVGASSQFGDMFYGATAFNQDLNSWDMTQAQNMGGMFTNASSFNGDITGWNTSKATVMGSMFSGATVFNRDISNWNTAKVQNFDGMFMDAKAFNQPIGKWTTTASTQIGMMFLGASSFNQNLNSWNFTNIADSNKRSFAVNTALTQANAPQGITVGKN